MEIHTIVVEASHLTPQMSNSLWYGLKFVQVQTFESQRVSSDRWENIESFPPQKWVRGREMSGRNGETLRNNQRWREVYSSPDVETFLPGKNICVQCFLVKSTTKLQDFWGTWQGWYVILWRKSQLLPLTILKITDRSWPLTLNQSLRCYKLLVRIDFFPEQGSSHLQITDK